MKATCAPLRAYSSKKGAGGERGGGAGEEEEEALASTASCLSRACLLFHVFL